MTSYWGRMAREHWQRKLPDRYAALEDPDGFFADIDDHATGYYAAIRDDHIVATPSSPRGPPTSSGDPGDTHPASTGPAQRCRSDARSSPVMG